MDRPTQALYTPPAQTSAPQEDKFEEGRFDEDMFAEEISSATKSDPKEDAPAEEVNGHATTELSNYDTTMSTLASLQVEYGETFADEDVPAAEAFAQRKALQQEMGVEYHRMITTAVKTFHARTRCLTCKETPITIDYFAMNHSLPKGAWVQWRDLCKKMEQQRPEILDEKEWIEFLGEMKTIETWYWEDNTASVECGRVSWNGNFAPYPVSSPDENIGSIAVNTPYSRPPRPYGKVVARYGQAI